MDPALRLEGARPDLVPNHADSTNCPATTSPLLVRLLGGLSVTADRPILFPTRKTGLLFAYLALHAGEESARSKLKALLWSDRGEQQASGSLRRAIADLRKSLAGGDDLRVLASTQSTVSVLADAVDVDVARFQRLAAAEDGSVAAAEIYRGDLLGDILPPDPAFEDWLRIERARLRGTAADLAEHLAGHADDPRALEAAAALAGRLLHADPTCEEAHRALIMLYLKAGRRNAAVKQYAACVEALRTALDVDPEDKTRQLIFDPAAVAVPTPPLPAATVAKGPSDSAGARAPIVVRAEAGRAVILAAKVVGDEGLVASDARAAPGIGAHRDAVAEQVVAHGGRVVEATGDSLVAAFERAESGVGAAVAIQRALHRRNADPDAAQQVAVHIGVHVNDASSGLAGDAVAIPARLREAASRTGICISGTVRDLVEGKLDVRMGVHERALEGLARPVAVHCVDWRDHAGTGDAPSLPDEPSIAVLPFLNLSGDPGQEYFADGLTEDIVTALSKFRWLMVIARNSTLAYKGADQDVRGIGRELGARYTLKGSVRRAGQRIRVTGQLIEAETGTHLWADRYDRVLADLFDLQDDLTRAIVTAIEPELGARERSLARRKPTESLTAWELYQRGLSDYGLLTPESLARARDFFTRSIAADPEFALPYAGLGRTLGYIVYSGRDSASGRTLAEAFAAARKALDLDARCDAGYHALCFLQAIAHRADDAVDTADRGIALNPNNALLHFNRAQAQLYRADPDFDRVIADSQMALRLSPNDPMRWIFHAISGIARFMRDGDDPRVLKDLEAAIHAPSADWQAWFFLAVAAARRGDGTLARRGVSEALTRHPDLTLGTILEKLYFSAAPDHFMHAAESLTELGLPRG